MIPVFHDDQHGTAVVALAALINALKVVGKDFGDVRVAVSGAGAAGIAVTKFLLSFGAKDVILCDSRGVIHRDRSDLNPSKQEIARVTNPRNVKGTLADALAGADVFLGLSVAGIVTPANGERAWHTTLLSSPWPIPCPRSCPIWHWKQARG